MKPNRKTEGAGIPVPGKTLQRIPVHRITGTGLHGIVSAFLLVMFLFVSGGCSFAAERPNIVTIFIDDMGYRDLSCFGGDKVQTKNIDRLAGEGLKFTNFYVNSPICSPSRVALTTGQYPQRWRISSYLDNRATNERRGMAQWLDTKAPVLARELQKSGYATGHFGKWHMGGQRDVGDAPLITEYGFDRSLTNFEGLGPRVLGYLDAYNGKKPEVHDLGSRKLPTGPVRLVDRSVVTTSFVDGALEFINEAQAEGKPFFVNLWPDDVHSPFFPPEVLRDKTNAAKRDLYYTVLKAMDEQLAPLIDRIRDDGNLSKNTLIIVCSDNGPEQGAGLSYPLRGAKTWLYEGGIRSSLIVWGPGLLASESAGTTNVSSVFSAIDLNRSLYEITGTSLPYGVELDGENLASTLKGGERGSREAPIFFRRPPDRPGMDGEDNPDLAVRDGKWKFLINLDGSDPQLYNLEEDVREYRNLVGKYPEEAVRLKNELFAWNASLPVDGVDPRFKNVGTGKESTFVNPIGEGADPWVVWDEVDKRYLWCLSVGNRKIAIHSGDNLTDLGTRHIVWEAPENGPCSREIWAPELHRIGNKWYIYFAGSDGKNENHLAYVLESETADPLGKYTVKGPLATGGGKDGRSPNIWAIDMTHLEHKGKHYAIWSGWDEPRSDRQFLYIAPMKSPTELSGPRVLLSENDDYPWEFTEDDGKGRGLHEGPQVLKHDGQVSLAYSCGASWLPTYKLGLLKLTGDDPLDPAAWEKSKEPVFRSTEETYGVGHSCFVPSPDGSEWWHVFHAKRSREPGWQRGIFIQPMKWDKETKLPVFGEPVAPGKPLPRPSGEVSAMELKLPLEIDLSKADSMGRFSYLGHHQRIRSGADGLTLGISPEEPVNDFQAGEKVMLRGEVPGNLRIETSFRFLDGNATSAAGILFRTSAVALGFDAQKGYYADFNASDGSVNLGTTDGHAYHHLKKAGVKTAPGGLHKLAVEAVGEGIRIFFDGEMVLGMKDGTYSEGGVGLRVVRDPVVFESIKVSTIPVR